jgi:hypothetical protein
MPITGRARGRQIRQALPKAPPVYDQLYISQLADAVNDYMIQATALGEVAAARFVCVDPISIPSDVPDPTTLPTGMLYLAAPNGSATDSTVCGQAWATGTIVLTTTYQSIPGCTFTLTRPGTWLMMTTYDFLCANEQGALLYGSVSDSPHLAVCDTGSNTGRFTVGNQELINISSTQVIQMTAKKTGGSGNSSTSTECSLTVVWIAGPPTTAGNGQFFTVVTPQDPTP